MPRPKAEEESHGITLRVPLSIYKKMVERAKEFSNVSEYVRHLIELDLENTTSRMEEELRLKEFAYNNKVESIESDRIEIEELKTKLEARKKQDEIEAMERKTQIAKEEKPSKKNNKINIDSEEVLARWYPAFESRNDRQFMEWVSGDANKDDLKDLKLDKYKALEIMKRIQKAGGLKNYNPDLEEESESPIIREPEPEILWNRQDMMDEIYKRAYIKRDGTIATIQEFTKYLMDNAQLFEGVAGLEEVINMENLYNECTERNGREMDSVINN